MPENEENKTLDTQVAKGEVIDFEKLRREAKLFDLKRRSYEAAIREAICRVDPVVTVRIGGKDYKLSYPLGVCLTMYKDLGKNPGQGQITDADLNNLEWLPKILWYGMQENHAKDGPSLEEILSKLSTRHIPYIQAVVSKALSVILPDEELINRIELEMGEDPEFRPFVQVSGSTGSSPSAE